MKILVADDSVSNLTQITHSLANLGHEVITTSNTNDIIKLFQEFQPNLFIIDVMMSKSSDFGNVKKFREIRQEDWVPIIYLSTTSNFEEIVKVISTEGDEYLIKPYNETILRAKIKNLENVITLREKLNDLNQQLNFLSATDQLTGIYNRLQFDKTIKERLSFAHRHQHLLALLVIDINKFKAINDSLGYYIGDILLKKVATRLKSCLRLEDFVARIGGDQFAVILSEIKNEDEAGIVAQKVIKNLSTTFDLAGNNINISCSIGIACYPSNEGDHTTLVQNADIAMYHAKQTGHNNYQFFNQKISEENTQKMNLSYALKFALEKNEIILMYQPIIDLTTNKIVRVEAIPYWIHPTYGLVKPDDFLPLASEVNLDDSINKWLIRSVCEQGAIWHRAGLTNFKITLKLSPTELLQKNLPRFIKNILEDTYLPGKMLEIGLTDTSLITYSTLSEEIIQEIHGIGVDISLDNFGSGYSSIKSLKRLPIKTLKIDKTIVQDTKNSDGVIIKSIITLGKNLDIDVIAEGITTKEHLQFLLENKCEFGQGDYFCEVKNKEEITEMLRKHQQVKI